MKTGKNGSLINRLIPLIIILSVFAVSAVSMFSIQNLQGDARVINYTGIVRGATQRLIKQELHQVQNDELIEKLDEILEELARGGDRNQLIPLPSEEYQDYIDRMSLSWGNMKEEIMRVRQGADPQKLYQISEDYFILANDAVSSAEKYSERMVSSTAVWLILLNCILIVFIILLLFYQKRQKKIAAELARAESASQEKSRFLSRMSHEIRTPMNGIIGMVEIARLSAGDPEKVEDCLNKIQLSSDYLLSLINDILDMSRIESGKIELYAQTFDLQEFVERLRTMFLQKAEEAGLKFEVSAQIDSPSVSGDKLRLSQIAVNIISNAIKFTPAGGSVRVRIEQKDLGGQKCSLKITVEDTGIGMTKEFQSRIFEPFEQADSSISHQYGGTGLGLAISHNLIQLMGGDIQIDSEYGRGTVFTICLTLPVVEEELTRGEEDVQCCGQEGLKDYRILLAEDNEMNSEIAVSLLGFKGAEVDQAWNGEEAVKRFVSSAPGTYDVVLMDIQMPVMNGLEASRKIRSSGHAQAGEIPIIGLSANAFEQDRETAQECGMNGYVSKPFDLEKLVALVRGQCPVPHRQGTYKK